MSYSFNAIDLQKFSMNLLKQELNCLHHYLASLIKSKLIESNIGKLCWKSTVHTLKDLHVAAKTEVVSFSYTKMLFLALTPDMKMTKSSEVHTSEAYPCSRCGKIFAYQYYRDKHLKYTRCIDRGDRKFPCNLCTRSFEKRDRLRIHVLHVHEKHRPHKCAVCGKCELFSVHASILFPSRDVNGKY